MHSAIRVSREGVRGCGWRKPGGLYLVGSGFIANCGRLPIPLTFCPCCGRGYKPSRGWTWVQGDAIMSEAPPCREPKRICRTCNVERLSKSDEMAGLIWVGEMHYKTPRDFLAEAMEVGVSRRVPAVPKGFKVGKTTVLLAHRHAVPPAGKPEFGKPETAVGSPGIFCAFVPQRIEVIVTGSESNSVIEGYIKRGLSPVKVVRDGELMP